MSIHEIRLRLAGNAVCPSAVQRLVNSAAMALASCADVTKQESSVAHTQRSQDCETTTSESIRTTEATLSRADMPALTQKASVERSRKRFQAERYWLSRCFSKDERTNSL